MNIEKLKGVIPDGVYDELSDTISKFEINTALRLAHFLAQCAHESAGFTAKVENLNYSAEGLKKVFPSYFPDNLSKDYARQPEKIANRVYANRMGNGDEKSGEGYKFRGRGYIQITGKNNYTSFSKLIKESAVKDPDIVSTKYPLYSAGWFFSKNCLKKCDAGETDAVVTSVTKCVNGGTNGLADRIKYFKKYYALLK